MQKLEEFGLSECEKRILIRCLRRGWMESSIRHHISLERVKKEVRTVCEERFDNSFDNLVKLGLMKSRNYPVLTRDGYKIVSEYYKRIKKMV